MGFANVDDRAQLSLSLSYLAHQCKNTGHKTFSLAAIHFHLTAIQFDLMGDSEWYWGSKQWCLWPVAHVTATNGYIAVHLVYSWICCFQAKHEGKWVNSDEVWLLLKESADWVCRVWCLDCSNAWTCRPALVQLLLLLMLLTLPCIAGLVVLCSAAPNLCSILLSVCCIALDCWSSV